MSKHVGDELLPILCGSGPLPAAPSTEWHPDATALYETLRALESRTPPPWSDAQILDAAPTPTREAAYRALCRLRKRQALVNTIQAISSQLEQEIYDPSRIAGVLSSVTLPDPPVPLSVRLQAGSVKPPTGLPVGFPSIQKATGGIIGMWVVGGETGVGKSTFALQVACEIAKSHPVIYYDAENGEDVLASHVQIAHSGAKTLSFADRLYIRSSVATMETDLKLFPPPALIIVDSAQKFGYELGGRSYREAINALIRRLELIKRSGYSVILVSEISRASYGQVSNAGYAETRELEFSADVAAQIVLQSDDRVEFHITKNRHKPVRGYVTSLERVTDWSFAEIEWDKADDQHDVYADDDEFAGSGRRRTR